MGYQLFSLTMGHFNNLQIFRKWDCKYGRRCTKTHLNEKCENLDCLKPNCVLRHPKICRYMEKFEYCKFGIFCNYEHNFTKQISESDKVLKELKAENEKINETLENIKIVLDDKISALEDLTQKYEDLKHQIILKEAQNIEVSDSEIESELVGSRDDLDREEVIEFKCDLCNFKTVKTSGLKIHRSRMHKEKFQIQNPEHETFAVEPRGSDSNCFEIFRKAAADKPLVLLHSDSCLDGNSLSCSELLSVVTGSEKDRSPILDGEKALLHVSAPSVLKFGVVEWYDVYEMIVGFGLEDY